jgi:ubiquitin-protein ligase E3 A
VQKIQDKDPLKLPLKI